MKRVSTPAWMFAFFIAGIALAYGCGGGGDGGGAVGSKSEVLTCNSATVTYCVDSATGNDGNTGAADNPFKTITHALSLATSGDLVFVRPGTYDLANGETFPLALPDGVTLVGNESNKGVGASPTEIVGGATLPSLPIESTIDAGSNSVIAGFLLNNNTGTPTFALTLALRNPTVTVRNNSITGSDIGLYMFNGAGDHVIIGNVVNGMTTGFGMAFVTNGGVGSRIENNVFTNNSIGVEYDSAGGDMGGGIAGSTGGNILSCNTRNDFWTNSGVTVFANNNLWDNAPPTVESTETGSGVDIFNSNLTSTINTSGAGVAPAPCP